MIRILLALIAIISAVIWASPSDADLAQCEKRYSRETCLHTIYP